MKRATLAVLSLLVVATLAPVVAAPPGLTYALRAQRALAQERPGDPQILNDLGNLLVLAGEFTEGEEVYRQALDLDPQFVDAHYNLALLMHQKGRRARAMRELRKVLKLEPDHSWSIYQMGTLHAEAGDRKRAVRHYARAFSLDSRLTLSSVNPHILDNELATQALLMTHSSSPAAKLAPRMYEHPGRITELLIPELPQTGRAASTETERESAAGGAAIESDRGAEGQGSAAAVAAPQTERRDAAPVTERQEVDSGAQSAESVRQSLRRRIVAGSADRSTAEGGRPPTGGPTLGARSPGQTPPTTGSPGTVAAGREPQIPPGESPEAPDAGRVAEPTTQAPPEPGEPGYEPGLSSTGRLDLRLIPVARDRLASRSTRP